MRYLILTQGRYMYCLRTDKLRKTDSLIKVLISKMGKRKKFCEDDVNMLCSDDYLVKELRNRTDFCEMQILGENDWKYYSFKGKNFTINIPLKDCNELIFL